MLVNKKRLLSLSLVACMGMAGGLHAGKIVSVPQGAPSAADGYGGWNLDNVDVFITDTDYVAIAKDFNVTDGSYDTMTYGDSFESQIKDDGGTMMAKLHGKDWPVGEPAGIKVVQDISGTKNNKPGNCIMTTSYLELADDPTAGYLDTVTPTQTDCASPFQTHKRFKVNMLPSTLDGGVDSIDLVFNVEPEAGTRRYQLFQKINNYTDSRLKGYSVRVGFGVGATFVEANTSTDVNLSLGIGEGVDPVDIWADNEMANFAHGLFGPPDKHFPEQGFFSNVRAGYLATLDANNKVITSGASLDSLGSNYETLFGEWLPSQWVPTGIFHDFDNDPTTDADLVAFWADVDGDGNYSWTRGDLDGFAEVDSVTLAEWSLDPLYNIGRIEDLLNLGLNYIVNVGDVSTFPNATFTVRITPVEALTQPVPGWIATTPALDYNSSAGAITINPDPFEPGTALIVRVADSDLNLNPAAPDSVDINVTNDQGEVELVTLNELDVNSSVFEGTLDTNDTAETGADNDGILNVTAGTLVTATYHDADDGTGSPATVTDTATAAGTAAINPYFFMSDDDGIFAVNDRTSLILTILAFLAVGALIARRKLA